MATHKIATISVTAAAICQHTASRYSRQGGRAWICRARRVRLQLQPQRSQRSLRLGRFFRRGAREKRKPKWRTNPTELWFGARTQGTDETPKPRFSWSQPRGNPARLECNRSSKVITLGLLKAGSAVRTRRRRSDLTRFQNERG